ncbi:MAG TPA: DinB family protein [Ktedonobacterales bacterium]
MTDDATRTLAAFYQGWENYQELLIKAIAPLTSEQLALRAAPHLRSIEMNCRHMIGARGRWCHLALGLGDEAFAALGRWDRRDAPERSAAELVNGLRQSWEVLRAALASWSPADLAYTIPNTDREPGEPEVFTRQWVIWHLIEHDLHHGGEISLTLGMHDLTAPDL